MDLFTLMGKRVQTVEIFAKDQLIRMDLSDLPAGVYLLKAGNHSKRIVKVDAGF